MQGASSLHSAYVFFLRNLLLTPLLSVSGNATMAAQVLLVASIPKVLLDTLKGFLHLIPGEAGCARLPSTGSRPRTLPRLLLLGSGCGVFGLRLGGFASLALLALASGVVQVGLSLAPFDLFFGQVLLMGWHISLTNVPTGVVG